MNELIGKTKIAIIDYYDDTKYAIENERQEVMMDMQSKNQNTDQVSKDFEKLLKTNESLLDSALKRFNNREFNKKENRMYKINWFFYSTG